MIRKLVLGKGWQFREASPKEISKEGTPQLCPNKQWLTAKVPGNVFLDLMSHRLIPDPFKETNEAQVQWVEERNWVYRTEFTISDKLFKAVQNGPQLEICFEGLDTFATVFLNQKKLGETDNMFIGWHFHIGKMINSGHNELVIYFRSPKVIGQRLINRYGRAKYSPSDASRSYLRRAQFLTGWDWGPRLSAVGIWKPVFLRLTSIARMENTLVKIGKITKRWADVELKIELWALESVPLDLTIAISFANKVVAGSKSPIDVIKGTNTINKRFKINRPRLWWPAGYGAQPLYKVDTRITRNGKVIDEQKETFGLRKVELLRRPDKQGESFGFLINGKKLFCRGMNWIPADILLPRLTETDYDDLLTKVRDANANCLRVWGGGIYEHDSFYHLCDRLGIMVWQDFMFSCAHYPEYTWFTNLVKKEIAYVIKHYRNHPSIICWCGNNENEMLHYANFNEDYKKMPGHQLFSQIIPKLCQRLDPTRPYWPSSPFGGQDPNSENFGDRHNWLVWGAGQKFETYRQDNGRFLSEFGFQALPCLETMKSFTKQLDVDLASPTLEAHQKMPQGNCRLLHYLKTYAWLPQTFAELVYLTQLIQGEALKFGVEHWRTRKFATAGTLIWQLNDCWPVISWSLLDYYHRPKAGYYYAGRFLSSVHIILKNDDGKLRCIVVNDTMKDRKCWLKLSAWDFTGSKLKTRTYQIRVHKNSRQNLPAIALKDLNITNKVEQFVYAQLLADTRLTAENVLLLAALKNLRLRKPEIKIKSFKLVGDDALEMELVSPVFVKAVGIHCPDERWRFTAEDNFFDLIPNVSKRIKLKFDQPIKPEEVIKFISFRSLNQFMHLKAPVTPRPYPKD